MRWLRPLLIVFIFVAALVLAAVCALTWLVTPQRIAERLTQTAEALHADFAMKGEISVDRLPTLRIHLPASTLTWQGGTLAFESADISLSPFAIFASSPKIENLTLASPELTLEAGASWRPSVRPQGFDIARLDVTKGRLRAGALTLDDLKGSALNVDETGASFSFDARLRAGEIDGRTQLSAHAAWAKDFSEAELQTAILKFDGLYSLRPYALSANAHVLRVSATDCLTGDRLHAELTDATRRWSLDAPQALLVAKRLQSNDLKLRLDGPEGRFSAQGRLSASLDSPVWSFSDAVLTSQNPAGEAAPESRMSGSLASDAAGVLTLSLEGRFLGEALQVHVNALPRLADEPRHITGDIVLGRWHPTEWAALADRLAVLTDWRVDTALRIGMVDGTAASDVVGHFAWEKGTAQLIGATGRLWGGTMSTDATYTPDGRWTVHAQVENADALNALTRSGLPAWASGRLSGTMTLSGEHGAASVPALTLEGRIDDGRLLGIDLPMAHRLALTERTDEMPLEVVSEKAKSDVTDFTFKLEGPVSAPTLTALNVTAPEWRFDATLPAPLSELKLVTVFPPQDREPGFTLPVSPVVANEGVRWSPDWAQTANVLRERLGDDSWTIDGIKRRAERWWKNFEASLPEPEALLDKAKEAIGLEKDKSEKPAGAGLGPV